MNRKHLEKLKKTNKSRILSINTWLSPTIITTDENAGFNNNTIYLVLIPKE